MQASRRTSRELAHAAVGGIPSPSPTSTYVFLQVFCFFPFSFLTLSMLFIASFSLRGDEGTLTVAFNVPVAASGRGGEDAAQAPYGTGPNVDAFSAAELREPYKQYTGLYTFVDEPARFGPRITDAGVRGRLFLAEPLDACEPIKSPFELTGKNSTSIVLIQRGQRGYERGGQGDGRSVLWDDDGGSTQFGVWVTGGNATAMHSAPMRGLGDDAGACTFYDKVMRAQAAGYAAAIVFDNEYEGLVVMNVDPTKPKLPDPKIPSVFISMDDGNVIANLLAGKDELGEYFAILSSGSINEQLWGNMLASMFMAALCLSIILASIIVIRRRRSLNQFYIRLALDALQEQNEGGAGAGAANTVMRQEDLDAIPVVKFDSAQMRSEYGDEGSDALADAECGACASDVDRSSAAECGTSTQRSFDTSNATWETCTICLDEYEDGEMLRELPCGHAFHRECIDLWLTTKASFCPMCKADCSVVAAAGGASSATEETPLLTEGRGPSDGGANLRDASEEAYDSGSQGTDADGAENEEGQRGETGSTARRTILSYIV